MDETISQLRVKERLSRILGSDVSEYHLIVQVGSSVVSESALCADIDVIGLSESTSRCAKTPKRVFSEDGEMDIEFSVMPASFPALLLLEPELNFYLFRERRKIEKSKLLFGSKSKHKQLVALLRSLPLPKKTILSFLSQVQQEMLVPTKHEERSQVSVFFSLLMLLGYTHFINGPVKPKWMYGEVCKCGNPTLTAYTQTLLEPIKKIGLYSITNKVKNAPNFVRYWETNGTSWRDALFLAKADCNASALTLLFCLHVYSASASATAGDPATEIYAEYLNLLRRKKCSLRNSATNIITAVETAM
ncbi:MAG: hypothetical protein H0U45_14550 [Tatlockia sp.]|jgi:hypothetical protein|nr:hypothetical protein [Tatlockia sp.]